MSAGCVNHDFTILMNHPCTFWNGRCTKNHWGGKPDLDLCLRVCPDYSGPDRGQLVQATISANVRWLGLTWIGVPWPKRIRLRGKFPFVFVRQSHGCGCVKPLKSIYVAMIDWVWSHRRTGVTAR